MSTEASPTCKPCCTRIPSFAELGKNCNDLMTGMYLKDQFKIKASSSASKTLGINAEVVNNNKTGSVTSYLETVCTPGNSLKVNTKWKDDNAIDMKASYYLKKPIGLKLDVQGVYQPKEQTCTSTIKGELCRPYMTVTNTLSKQCAFNDKSKSTGVSLDKAFVFGYKNNYVGGKIGLLQDKGFMPTSTKFACCYRQPGYELYGSLENLNKLSWSVFTDKTPSLKLGTTLKYDTVNSTTEFCVGSRLQLDDKTVVASKVSSNFVLGLALKHRVTEFASVCLSSELNMKTLNQPSHNFGLAIEFSS